MELEGELELSNWYHSPQKVLKNNCNRENTMTQSEVKKDQHCLLTEISFKILKQFHASCPLTQSIL